MTPSLEAMRQSAAEILAYSVVQLFPDSIPVQGERTDIGFYYDFVMHQPIHEQAIPLIEEKMREVIRKDLPLVNHEMMRENAVELFKHHGLAMQANRVALAESNIVPVVQIGEFYDYCHPPYVATAGEIGPLRILEVQHVSHNDLEVVRIVGTVFYSRGELKEFVKKWGKKQDSGQLCQELNIFFERPEGLFWLPKGVALREGIISWLKGELNRLGGQFVSTPGGEHLEIFRYLNPGLPAKYSEITENKDFTTIFCTSNQLKEEATSSLQFIRKTINIFGFEYQWYLVTQEKWEQENELLSGALNENGLDFVLDVHGNEVSGPRIEANIVDSLGQRWPGPFLEIDFSARDLAILRMSVFHSLEGFVARLIEHHSGQLPLWIAPEQVRIIPVAERHQEYAGRVQKQLQKAGLRAECEEKVEKLGTKVHAAIQEKIPYIAIIGDKEVDDSRVTVRSWKQQEVSRRLTVDELFEEIDKNMNLAE